MINHEERNAQCQPVPIAGDHDVVVRGDEAPFGEGEHDRAVKTARGAEVDVLDRRLVSQLGSLRARGEPARVTGVGLPVDE
jgi:hypothetical protein